MIAKVENTNTKNRDEQVSALDLLENDIDFVDLTESE